MLPMAIRLLLLSFQHTAARRRLGAATVKRFGLLTRFNTQPPEGGWFTPNVILGIRQSFNTQPPEGGWPHLRVF